jgi:Golgi SNAP receptor complex protein 2
MEALYHQTNKMVQDVQNQLGRLERASTPEENHQLEVELQTRIDQIVSNCERLELLVNKEPPSRRATAKLRVDQLKYDCQHLQAAKRNVQHRRYQKEEEERERELLMSRVFATPNDETQITIDAALQHNQHLHSATHGVDEILHTGTSLLANLRDQRGTLKNVQRKVLDMMTTLGLSNTVMRLIDRRAHQDKFILFGGMLVTCIIMFLVWKYLA